MYNKGILPTLSDNEQSHSNRFRGMGSPDSLRTSINSKESESVPILNNSFIKSDSKSSFTIYKYSCFVYGKERS